MGLRQIWLEFEGFAHRPLGCRKIVAAEEHTPFEQVSWGGIGRKLILRGKRMPRIVVARGVNVAESKDIVRIHILRDGGTLSPFKERYCFGWFSLPEEASPLHLHRFQIAGVLRDGIRKGLARLPQFTFLVKHKAAQVFRAGGFRSGGSEPGERVECLVE